MGLGPNVNTYCRCKHSLALDLHSASVAGLGPNVYTHKVFLWAVILSDCDLFSVLVSLQCIVGDRVGVWGYGFEILNP